MASRRQRLPSFTPTLLSKKHLPVHPLKLFKANPPRAAKPLPYSLSPQPPSPEPPSFEDLDEAALFAGMKPKRHKVPKLRPAAMLQPQAFTDELSAVKLTLSQSFSKPKSRCLQTRRGTIFSRQPLRAVVKDKLTAPAVAPAVRVTPPGAPAAPTYVSKGTDTKEIVIPSAHLTCREA